LINSSSKTQAFSVCTYFSWCTK